MNKLLLLCLATAALAAPANAEASIGKRLSVNAEAYRNRQQTFQLQKKKARQLSSPAKNSNRRSNL